jgi:GYF domain 2
MATVATAAFAGALFGIALISRIPIWALGAWEQKSFPRLLIAHLLTYGAAATAYAFASSNGGPPEWQAGLAGYAGPSLLVLGLDAFAITANRRRAAISATASLWFLHAGGTQSGPLTTDALKAQLARGSVHPYDWIWRNGFKEWAQIQSVDLTKVAEPAASGKITSATRPSRSLWRDRLALPSGYWIGGPVGKS